MHGISLNSRHNMIHRGDTWPRLLVFVKAGNNMAKLGSSHAGLRAWLVNLEFFLGQHGFPVVRSAPALQGFHLCPMAWDG